MTPRKLAGFTFIETIIVVMILGIVVLLALPLMDTALTEARLSGGVDEIVTALEFAQLSAVGAGRSCRVTVDASADSVLVEQAECATDLLGAEAQLAEAAVEQEAYATMANPLKADGDYDVVFADEPRLEGVDIQSAAFGGGNQVVFDALGAPSDSGTVVVACGGRNITLTVDRLSGRVSQSE